MTVAIWQEWEKAPAIAASFGSLTGALLSPDLDADHKTRSEWVLIQSVPVIGHLFYYYWLPYAKLVKHRHWSSHWPIVGTALRLVYLAPLVIGIFYALDRYTTVDTGKIIQWLLTWSKWWIIGLTLSDAAHWLRDSW